MHEKVTRASRPPVADEAAPDMGDYAQRTAIIGIFIIAVVAALIYSRPIAVPIVTALILGALIGAVVDGLAKRGIPPPLASTAIILAMLALLYGVAIAFSAPLSTWIGRAPELGAILQERFAVLKGPFEQMKDIQRSLSSITGGQAALTVDTSASIFESVLSFATPALTQFLLFLGTLVFFLASRLELKRKLVIRFETRESRLAALRVLANIERALGQYLGTVTLINLGLGVATALAMALIGIPNPGLWGILAFVMNFVPYIGPAAVAIILFGVGLVTYPALAGALIPPSVFLFLNLIEGHFVTPNVLGRRLTLNPFIVFVALAFWAWIWGPVGAFLAVPILVSGFVIADQIRDTDEVVKLPG